MKESIHTFEKDQYGNETKRITRYIDFFEVTHRQYNDKNDLILELKTDKNNETIFECYYEYVYDKHGNKVKVHQVNKHMDSMDCDTDLLFINEYDDENRLQKVTSYDQNKEVFFIKTYYYESGLLTKKLEYKNPFTQVYRSSYYQYNKNNELICKQVNNSSGEVSYYITYTLLENLRYNKFLLSPSKGKYSWILDTIESDACYIEIKEPSFTPDILRDIYGYLVSQFPHIHFITISISESEDITYHNELAELMKYYDEYFNIHISLDM